MMLFSVGAPLTPAGGSSWRGLKKVNQNSHYVVPPTCNLLKSLIRRLLAAVVILISTRLSFPVFGSSQYQRIIRLSFSEKFWLIGIINFSLAWLGWTWLHLPSWDSEPITKVILYALVSPLCSQDILRNKGLRSVLWRSVKSPRDLRSAVGRSWAADLRLSEEQPVQFSVHTTDCTSTTIL